MGRLAQNSKALAGTPPLAGAFFLRGVPHPATRKFKHPENRSTTALLVRLRTRGRKPPLRRLPSESSSRPSARIRAIAASLMGQGHWQAQSNLLRSADGAAAAQRFVSRPIEQPAATSANVHFPAKIGDTDMGDDRPALTGAGGKRSDSHREDWRLGSRPQTPVPV